MEAQMPLAQRQQQVEGFGSERDSLAVAQQDMFRSIQAKRAEFIDVSWLLVHRCFATPSIKGSATPEHKYPEFLRHAASEADHQASTRAKLRSALEPAGNL